MVECNEDCSKCKQLNIRTDEKGYPFGYDCIKYGDSVFEGQFKDTKIFKTMYDFQVTVEELEKDFISVCSICLDNDDLVNEFCRLKGLKRPDKRSLIEVQIDNACGYDAGMDFMRQFTDFVREFIYIPLLRQRIG